MLNKGRSRGFWWVGGASASSFWDVILRLGERRYDVSEGCLVMGILNRTTDSFYDAGAYWRFDDFLRKAEELAAEGADILDVGGVRAAPGEEISADEEASRVLPAIEALAERFDIPLSVDTWRASVAEAAYASGAVLGNDISGFADPDYLEAAAAAGASVVACHVRLAPRLADPNPSYGDLFSEVRSYLLERAGWAETAGLESSQILLDVGLDLGKTPEMSTELLRKGKWPADTADPAGAGSADTAYPVLMSASNKGFLGRLCGRKVGDLSDATAAAHFLGALGGCAVIRAHDVCRTRRMAAIACVLKRRRGDLFGGDEPLESATAAASAETRRKERAERPEHPERMSRL